MNNCRGKNNAYLHVILISSDGSRLLKQEMSSHTYPLSRAISDLKMRDLHGIINDFVDTMEEDNNGE